MKRFSPFSFQLSMLILLFSFCACFSLHASELSLNEQKALSYVRELCFEITRYNTTGLSSSPESVALASVSKIGSALLCRRKIRGSVQDSVYLCEFYFPEKIGIIDSSFCPEDAYATNEMFGLSETGESEVSGKNSVPNFGWIDLMLQGLVASPVEDAAVSEYPGMLDGEKILEMLENNDSRGIEAPNEGKNEYTYAKKDGSLRRFSYDGEQFTLWREGENTVLVTFYGDKLIRKTFDSLYRLVKTERFKTGSAAKKMSLETSSLYAYVGEAHSPESVVEENISAKKRFETHFDSKGRMISSLESHYEEQNPETKKNALLNDKKTSKRYDSEGRLTEEESLVWSYKTNSFGRRIVESRSVRNVYEYGDDERVSPTVRFYENGELHLMRKYTDADSYSETMYFDGGFSVEIFYENGIKKTEIIYMNNVEQRRRNFEY